MTVRAWILSSRAEKESLGGGLSRAFFAAMRLGEDLGGSWTLYDDGRLCQSLPAMIVPLTKVQLRQDEDGVWIAKSSLLPGCHAHGRDRGEATLRFQQAAKVHLEALLETGRPIPPAFRDKFILAG